MQIKMIKKQIKSFIFKLSIYFMFVKNKIAPEVKISMPKNKLLELNSRLSNTLNKETKIYNQIDDLSNKISSKKNLSFPELSNFDFELFKVRFQGDFGFYQNIHIGYLEISYLPLIMIQFIYLNRSLNI